MHWSQTNVLEIRTVCKLYARATTTTYQVIHRTNGKWQIGFIPIRRYTNSNLIYANNFNRIDCKQIVLFLLWHRFFFAGETFAAALSISGTHKSILVGGRRLYMPANFSHFLHNHRPEYYIHFTDYRTPIVFHRKYCGNYLRLIEFLLIIYL